MANEYLVNSADMTAVADALRAKGGTSEALAFPGGFVEAVGAIQAGAGGNAVQIGQDTPLNILKLFHTLETGNCVTGEFTLSSYIQNTPTLLFSTGLETVTGLLTVDRDWYIGYRGGERTVFSLFITLENNRFLNFCCNNGENNISFNWNATLSNPLLVRANTDYTKFDENGDFYVQAHFGGNSGYTPFEINHRILWVAW